MKYTQHRCAPQVINPFHCGNTTPPALSTGTSLTSHISDLFNGQEDCHTAHIHAPWDPMWPLCS